MTAIALTIAGSDSSGGAGIQADLKTFSALGVYGASVITALTAQNTQRVEAVHVVPPDFVLAQMRAVARGPRGRCHQDRHARHEPGHRGGRRRPQGFCRRPGGARSGHGRGKRRPAARPRTRSMRSAPCSCRSPTVITPNLPRPRRCSACSPARNEDEMADAGVAAEGAGRQGRADQRRPRRRPDRDRYSGRRRRGAAASRRRASTTSNTHGTGCTLSSAIAAELAKGASLREAVAAAKAYVTAAIAAADELDVGSGQGRGPVHHFHDWWATNRGAKPRPPPSWRCSPRPSTVSVS